MGRDGTSVVVHSFPDMSLVVRKAVFGVSTRSDTNRAAQLQKMARGLKFWIKEEEENKGADQLLHS